MSEDDKPTVPPPAPQVEDWRELAAKASIETDPVKLSELVQEMCDSIDHERAEKHLPPIEPRKKDPARDEVQDTSGRDSAAASSGKA